MTLGISKSYTPVAGQVPVASSYNTDIAALFNAFSGLEAQTSTLGGLTITPATNSTYKFTCANATGTTLMTVNTADGEVKYKSFNILTNNITNTKRTTDFSAYLSTFTALTGASGTLTTQRSNSNVLAIISGCFSYGDNAGQIRLRVNLDSGTEYKYYGINAYQGAPGGGAYDLFYAARLFTGLSAGSHTFSVEAAGNNWLPFGVIFNNCLTSSPQEYFELILIEI